MKYICPFCNKELKSARNYKIHINKCLLNPNISERYKRYALGGMDKNEEYIYKNVEQDIEYVCQNSNCNKKYIVHTTLYKYDIGDFSHYCSINCRNGHKRTDESKKKVSETLKKYFEGDYPPYIDDKIINECGAEYVINKKGQKKLKIFGKYLKVYKCKNCGKEFTSMHVRNINSAVYCSEECAEKCSYEDNKVLDFTHKVCNICGTINCTNEFCKDKSILHRINNLIKHFGFDKNKLGTIEVFDEWNRIKNIVEDMYNNKHMSTIEIADYFGCDMSSLSQSILPKFGIHVRNLSESRINYFANNDNATIPQHKEFINGCHTTWNGKEVYLRSSYEFDYAMYLDDCIIDYEVEKIKIQYYDSRLQKIRVAIPDFYIPSTNTIVEIKSTYTLDVQNMKDKVKKYKELGYDFKLILNHKEVNIDEIPISDCLIDNRGK